MTAESFATIYQRACERKGGEEQLQLLLAQWQTPLALAELSDAELLSQMSKKVFQSGFVWRVVDNKWPAYQQAFFDFEPHKVLMLSPDQIQQRAEDVKLIRHFKKTQAIYDNALMVHELAIEHGSFGKFLSQWPQEDMVGLWQTLKRKGQRLGGNTGPYFLRAVGKDTFLLTQDIQAYFKAHKLVDAGFTSKRGLQQVQQTFNHWQQQSNRSFNDISRILALSVGDNRL
ncbi:DNA-3-methyladenine glycosylase I [Shewanella sp. Scap07]|uniref:DNA-3-methyladenine glycosylase I n=1 Tax=Shewanella sp. Scap07 TaxID=2589987 RepID=UPI0015B9E7FF|nr:DNA-3-methyladenine glycosylase I [Shewanella sp. Scap07]QLE87481.1 DNA-3-methyladenine glycosylase I [Shewanella sp. Scap07]